MNLIDILVRPLAPPALIILFGTLLVIFLVWKELNRPSGSKILRTSATLVMIAAVAGLAFKPSTRSKIPGLPVMLLTKGYDRQKVDSLMSKYPGLQIIRSTNSAEYPGATIVSLDNLSGYAKAIKIICGEGLPRHIFDRNPNLSFYFFSAQVPGGITELQTETSFVSHRSTISGKFNNNGNPTKLILKGPGGNEDSIQIRTKGESLFSLHFTPRQSGKFSYELFSMNGTGKEFSEKIPLEIFPERKLNILFLELFPSTEIRYLKNFLADRGHGVVLRYQVSRNLYRYEFGNHATEPINHLSEGLLNDYDLLIISANGLKGLDEGDRKIIENSVRSGLGTIVILDEIPDPKLMPPLLKLSFKKSEADTVQLESPGGRQTFFSLPAVISVNRPTQMITLTKDQRMLSGYQFLDMGKVGFQSLRETYTLILKGLPDAYSEIWTPLIEQTAKNDNSSFKIIIKDQEPLFINDPIAIQVISSGERPTLQVDGISSPLIEDLVVNDLWHGKIWVGRSGWHQLMVTQDSTRQNFYVSQQDSTESLSLMNQMRSNRAHHADGVNLQVTELKNVTREIPYWIYFAMFLIAGAYLWLEPRI